MSAKMSQAPIWESREGEEERYATAVEVLSKRGTDEAHRRLVGLRAARLAGELFSHRRLQVFVTSEKGGDLAELSSVFPNEWWGSLEFPGTEWVIESPFIRAMNPPPKGSPIGTLSSTFSEGARVVVTRGSRSRRMGPLFRLPEGAAITHLVLEGYWPPLVDIYLYFDAKLYPAIDPTPLW